MTTTINGTTGVSLCDTNSVPTAAIQVAAVTPAKLSQSLTLDTAQNTTSGTSIDFTSIPSWVKRITILFNGVSTNGTSPVQVQIGAGSVDTTGYAGSATGLGAAASTNNYTSGFVLYTNNDAAAATRVGHLVLDHLGGNVWVAAGIIGLTNVATTSVSAFNKTLSGSLDRLRLTTVNGTDTFDAGSVNILYEG